MTRNTTTTAETEPDNGGVQTSCAEALPWGSLSRGAGSDVPRARHGLRTGTTRECVNAANRETKQTKKNALPTSVRKKGPQKTRAKLMRQVQEVPKTHGAEKRTPAKRRNRRTHGRNGRTSERKKTAAQEKNKRKKGTRPTKRAGGGV